MNSYEENVRAILQCCFSQSKDELIETAVKAIVAIKPEPITINPVNPITVPQPQVVPLPYTPITTSPVIKCDTDKLGDVTHVIK
jgi:hypothetical protein